MSDPVVCGYEARTVDTDQYAPYPTPATSASTRTSTIRRARRPFFLPGFFASEEPEEAVVLAGIAVLRGGRVVLGVQEQP
ncbi:hypothetical protein GCM10027028_51270 [Streptomyces sundarbansensis]